jgi:predicted nucleic acid-binding protein
VIVADTSVVVPALLPWHRDHRAAFDSLPDRTRLLGAVAIEAYAVLTRLPQPHRVPANLALEYLRGRFQHPPLTLHGRTYASLLATAADKGIRGGAVYDAVIAGTARESGATLLTLDRRATRTYDLVGVDYRVVT